MNKCMHCGKLAKYEKVWLSWCSLPCKGHILERYSESDRGYRWAEGEYEYVKWLVSLPKDYQLSAVELVDPNPYIRREAEEILRAE